MTQYNGKAVEGQEEEEVLVEWIQENDPDIIIDIASFWVYNAYSIAPTQKGATEFSSEVDYYLS